MAAARKWHQKKRWRLPLGIIAFCALYLAGLETIPRFPFGPYVLYANLSEAERAARVPYEILADETSAPFGAGFVYADPVNVDGYPYQEGFPSREQRAAAARFPGVRDCLVKREQDKSDPDLRLIDWDLFETNGEAEICVWRILASLGTPARGKLWMEFHKPTWLNFEIKDQKRFIEFNSVRLPNDHWSLESETIFYLRSAWSYWDTGFSVITRGLWSKFTNLTRRRFGVRAYWNDAGKLMFVTMQHASFL